MSAENADKEHAGQHKDCRICRRGPTEYADTSCKLCQLPEGNSPFLRVGKRVVRHGDCTKAWSAEDRAKGREYMLQEQLKRIELELEAIDDKMAIQAAVGLAPSVTAD